jgi:hypothetical protein
VTSSATKPDRPARPACYRPCANGCGKPTRARLGVCGQCHALAGPGDPPAPAKRASEPTRESPGSPGKVEELRRRLWNGEHLWHDGDELEQKAGCTPLASAYTRTKRRKQGKGGEQ